jgi:hypothetical protein
VLPAGRGQAAETESTLALAENVYVNLPTPLKEHNKMWSKSYLLHL